MHVEFNIVSAHDEGGDAVVKYNCKESGPCALHGEHCQKDLYCALHREICNARMKEGVENREKEDKASSAWKSRRVCGCQRPLTPECAFVCDGVCVCNFMVMEQDISQSVTYKILRQFTNRQNG
jgi:hypothetical protein